ncbi:MAG: nicotinamide mononucleotide transporter [Bacteroidales bacterium]|nr:nicotinamide mononucleotide transporter [Bacteroidales bacterium]
MEISSFFEIFLQNLYQTTLLEIIAVVFGLLSVWYSWQVNILVYPTGIVNVLIYVYICFHAGLYADMGINWIYFVMSVYGWYNWTRKKEEKTVVKIAWLSLKGHVTAVLIVIISFVMISYVLVNYTDSTVPYIDAFTTSVFIVGMWLMAIKKIENWIYWIIGDIICLPMFYYKGLVFTSFQYFIFLILAVMGYYSWRKEVRNA